MSVSLTKSDIRRGIKDSPTCGPIALAVSRAQGGGVVSVYPSNILTIEGVYETPDEVWYWISSFESGRPLGPFKFILDQKEESQAYPMPDKPWPPFLWHE